VTNSIVKQIESNGILPWRCPWQVSSTNNCLPFNFASKRSYRGINTLILWSEAIMKGYSSNAWLTFKQAQALGGSVRKGETSTRCIYVGMSTVEKEQNSTKEDQWFSFQKVYSLFNIEQVDGVDLTSGNEEPLPDVNPCTLLDDSSDALLQAYCDNTGVIIRTGGPSAFYSPALDVIKMPTSFISGEGYIATLAHEIVHSTGHQKRLNRFDEQQLSFNRHKDAYAFEELIAELGSAFICAELNIEGQHEQHVSYLESWLRHFKSDTSFLFKAAAAASKAHRYIAEAAGLSEDNLSEVA